MIRAQIDLPSFSLTHETAVPTRTLPSRACVSVVDNMAIRQANYRIRRERHLASVRGRVAAFALPGRILNLRFVHGHDRATRLVYAGLLAGDD